MYAIFFKRSLDIIFSLIASILFFPICLILLLLIYLQDRKPPLFVQERVGKNGELFSLLKLRTMNHSVDEGETVSFRTAKNDGRITALGKLLRKSSLDELPQIFNVLAGHMSLVGPRPDVVEMKPLYSIDEWDKRCSVCPGITGLAQATIRSSGTQNERTRLDLEYVDRLSFSLDIWILIMTISKVAKSKHAN